MNRIFFFGFLLGCAPAALIRAPAPAPLPPSHPPIAVDTAPKEGPRLLPAEVYVRTYLQLFGVQQPLEAQKRARGGDGNQLFDNWNDYLTTLGFPDYKNDLPRATQTNALMVATFERLGVALCDRAVERDYKAPIQQRTVFAFEFLDQPDPNQFAERFDVLHRTFLGYPAALAGDRTQRFYRLFKETAARHAGVKSRFTPSQAAWAAVCHALVRHPEFHLY